MREVKVNVYGFDELPPTVQAKLIEKNRHMAVDDSSCYRDLVEEWEIRLLAMGYENAAIRFSGFGSPGDGASFTAKGIERIPSIYYHEKTVHVTGDHDENIVRQLCRQIYADLEKEYYFRTKDVSVAETLRGFEYFSNGDFFEEAERNGKIA